MIGSYGGIVFSTSESRVQNFKDLKRDVSTRYATHEIINSKPRIEYLGVALETASMTIELNANLGINVVSMIDKWTSYCKSGAISALVLGGRVIGTSWVVTSVAQAYGIITNNGRIISATLDISLQEYN